MSRFFQQSLHSDSVSLKTSFLQRNRSDQAEMRHIASALSSRFLLLRQLGGQDSNWYVGREFVRGRTVVLKAISEQQALKENTLETFHIEAGVSAALDHPCICALEPVEELNGVYFCVGKSAPGEPLRDLLDRCAWLDNATAVAIAYQIADALAYARTAGVLHLRLNPDRILVDRNGAVAVIDFGIRADSGDEQQRWLRSRLQDHEYCSPEEFDGDLPGYSEDLYSLGAILFEMLTDRLPFDSDEIETIRKRMSKRSSVMIPVLAVHAPESLARLVNTILEPNKDDRLTDIDTFLKGMALLPEFDLRPVTSSPSVAPVAGSSHLNGGSGQTEVAINQVNENLIEPAVSLQEQVQSVPDDSVVNSTESDRRRNEPEMQAIYQAEPLSSEPIFSRFPAKPAHQRNWKLIVGVVLVLAVFYILLLLFLSSSP